MLFIVDSLRRMLPTPLFNPVPAVAFSSDVILKVLGLGLLDVFEVCGRFAGGVDCTTPAETWISSRKLSLSEANFLSASSKASSSKPEPPTGGEALMVALLLLLAVGWISSVLMMLPMLLRASKLYRDLRLAASVGGEPGVGGLELSVSKALSSSMVSSTGGEGMFAAYFSW